MDRVVGGGLHSGQSCYSIEGCNTQRSRISGDELYLKQCKILYKQIKSYIIVLNYFRYNHSELIHVLCRQ